MKLSAGILFDVDGTLSDSFQLGFDSTNAVLKRNGIEEISADSYHQGTRYTTPTRLAWHVTGDTNNPIGEELGRQFDELYVELVSPSTAAFYDGMHQLLTEVKDKYPIVRYGALSNACGAYVRAVLAANNVDHIFEVQLGADDVAAPKPHPDGLLKLVSLLDGLVPSKCIYIGDSPTDGQAATAAGMLGIGVTWGSHSAESVAKSFKIVVHTIQELQDVIITQLKEIEHS